MKRKRNWKRHLCAMLAAAVLLAVPAAVSGAEKPEWRYGDGLYVHVKSEEARTFSPEDFPGIGCEKVFVLEKFGGKYYELVLMLNRRSNMSDSEYEEVIEKALQIPMVSRAERNYSYTPHPKSYLKFNYSEVYLAVSETVDIWVIDSPMRGYYGKIYGVKFRVEPSYFVQEPINKNSFSDCGITRFWPVDKGVLIGELLTSRPEELEGKESERAYYCGLAGDENENLFETIALLAADPRIRDVEVAQSVPGGNPPFGLKEMLSLKSEERGLALKSSGEEECWEMENPEIAEYTLSGGYPSLGKTAAVRALKPGITRIFAERNAWDDYVSSGCPIIVYEPGGKNNPGDLNHDGAVSTDDALQVLKHIAGMVSLDKGEMQTADLNGNGKITADDALLMLKITAGSINQEFVIK